MAASKKAPEGVFIRIFNMVYALTVRTEKIVEIKRGKKVVGTEVEVLDKPNAVLISPLDGRTGFHGMAGNILGANGKPDPKKLGECAVLVDGEVVKLNFVAGLTGTEGKLTAKGAPVKRNPKLDLGPEGVLVTWKGNVCKLSVGVSQTGDASVFVWGSLYPVAEKGSKQVDPTTLASLDDCAVDFDFEVV